MRTTNIPQKQRKKIMRNELQIALFMVTPHCANVTNNKIHI